MASSNRKRKLTANQRKERKAARKRFLQNRKSTSSKEETPTEKRKRHSKRKRIREARVSKIRAHARDPEGGLVFVRWAFFIFLNVVVFCVLSQLIPEQWHFLIAIVGVPYAIIVILFFLIRLYMLHYDLVDKHELTCPKCGRSSIRGPFSRRRAYQPPDDPAICFACRKDLLDT